MITCNHEQNVDQDLKERGKKRKDIENSPRGSLTNRNTSGKQKTRKKNLSEEEIKQRKCIGKIGMLCSQNNMIEALSVFEEMKQNSLKIEVSTFCTLFAVCAGAGLKNDTVKKDGGKVNPRDKRGKSDLQGPHEGSAEKNIQLAYQESQKLYSEFVSIHGLMLLPESAYTAMIRAACTAGEINRGLELLDELKVSKIPRTRTYAPLIRGCSKFGRFIDCYSLWKEAREKGILLNEMEYISLFSVCRTSGDENSFFEIMGDYMDKFWQPENRKTWEAIRCWFEKDGNWTIKECQVEDSGKCTNCLAHLESIDIKEESKNYLLKQISTEACTSDIRKEQWTEFTDWIEKNLDFDVVVDGANVGYFDRKINASTDLTEVLADLVQINWVVKYYEALGKKVLVILHMRHIDEEKISKKSAKVLEIWKAEKKIQTCHPKNNDDWYWLWAALKIGKKAMVVTNDEMRDHHFSMLSVESFDHWRERHQVRFDFGEWREGEREILVDEPSLYSKRIQRSPSGDTWHFPLEEEESWLCISKTH